MAMHYYCEECGHVFWANDNKCHNCGYLACIFVEKGKGVIGFLEGGIIGAAFASVGEALENKWIENHNEKVRSYNGIRKTKKDSKKRKPIEDGWILGRIKTSPQTIKKRGYGFIKKFSGGDVFFHISELNFAGEISHGLTVKFRVVETKKGEKAVDISGI